MNDESFLSIFFENYKKNPDKLISSDYIDSISWQTFICKANNFANEFKSIRKNIIPIIVDRTVNTPCAIVGCMLAKKIFVPISSEQPINRIKKILDQLDIEYILNLGNIKLPNNYSKIELQNFGKNPPKVFTSSIKGSEPLYILFTSGSTGIPKGVLVSHENLLNTIKWSYSYQKWNDQDIVGITTNFGFDISLFDLFSSLYSDIPHYIVKESKDPFQSTKEIINNNITSIFSAPSFFSSLVKSNLIDSLKKSSLRQIFSGGDFFPPAHINEFKKKIPKLEIYNVWGPTETSIVNTMHKISVNDIKNALDKKKDIPIGITYHERMSCFIVNDDRTKTISKPNQIGEIVVSGDSVSLGYFKYEENKDFIIRNNKKFFYTNDKGYFDNDFNLYITGRVGFTIKISGYRVNLKEIESQVEAYPLVHQAIAFNPKKYKNNIFIALELCNKEQSNLKFGELRSFLRKSLPSYMIPKHMVIIKELPKNINGKIDRKLSENNALEIFENE